MAHFRNRASVGCRGSLLLATLMLGITCSVATAQGATNAKPASDQELTAAFTEADKDKDKSLSPFEARHMPIAADFAKYDTNSDSYLSFEEYMTAMKGGSSTMKSDGKKGSKK